VYYHPSENKVKLVLKPQRENNPDGTPFVVTSDPTLITLIGKVRNIEGIHIK
jgi:hypothetical protein